MKIWEILSSQKILNSAELLEVLLSNRGISESEKDLFLNPPPVSWWLKNLEDSFKKSLRNSRNKILEYIDSNLPILIYGDYDADGVCATAILYNTIKNELNYSNVYYFIPNRFEHGYGLSEKSLDLCFELIGKPSKSLLITVDTGITAVKPLEYAMKYNFEVIVTDHHQKPEVLPNALEIVWNAALVGAGISYVISKGLGSKDSKNLALAALATVADLQPLTNFNRSIVKEGLEIFNSSPPVGISKLLQISGRKEGSVSAYDLGWILAPRINAAGRILDASESLALLIENDESKVHELALRLDELNRIRQDKTNEMYELISEHSEIPDIIISSHDSFHEGIIGIVASRLVQKYNRPSIVISLKEEYGKGSVRSIFGIDIISILRNFEDLFVNVGGHKLAAGFTIEKDKIPLLKSKIEEYFAKNISRDLLMPRLIIDSEIPLDLINLEMIDQLSKLEPYGYGNNEPVFCTKNVGITSINKIGKDKNHLNITVFQNNIYSKALFFNFPSELEELKVGERVDIAYTLKKSEFNNKIGVDLLIKDLKFDKKNV